MLHPLERLELAFRRALKRANPHKKSEVMFKELLQQIYETNLHVDYTEKDELNDLRSE